MVVRGDCHSLWHSVVDLNCPCLDGLMYFAIALDFLVVPSVVADRRLIGSGPGYQEAGVD
jgi:hypothetical protein